MFKYKNPFLIIIIISVFIFNSCSIGKRKEPLELVKVSVISHSVLYAPLYLADALDFFKEEGLAVKILTVDNNEKLNESLFSNVSDLIIGGPQGTIHFYDKNEEPLLSVAQVVQKDPSGLIARQPEPQFQWDSLHKKIIIGTSQNSTPQLMLEYILRKNKLEPYKKVDVIYNIPRESVIGAFKGGVGDYIHLLEPEATILAEDGGVLAASLADEFSIITYSNLIVKESLLNYKPQVIQKFINAIYKAQIWCKYHNEQEITLKLHPYFPELKANILKKVVARFKEKQIWAETPVISKEGFDKFQEVIISGGMRSQKLTFESLNDNTFSLKAQQEIPIPKEYTEEKDSIWRRFLEFVPID